MTVDFDKTIPQVEKLMRKVGRFQLQEQDNLSIRMKDKNNPVTQIDIESEKMLKEGLLDIITGASFRGEESAWSLWEGLCWIVDPLDGTHAYIRKDEGWTIIVTLMYDDEVLLGAIYSPLEDAFYHATHKSKAYRNDVPMSVDQTKNDVILSPRFKEMKLSLTKSIHFGGAYKAMLVAQGLAGAYFHFDINNMGTQVWDVAAPLLIVKKAGGVVCSFQGEELFLYQEDSLVKEVIFSNKTTYDLLKDKLESLKKDFIREHSL